MKVALVIRRYDALGGGAERWTDRHARWLLAHGHDVHLWASEFRQPPPRAVCHRVAAAGGRLGFAANAAAGLAHANNDVVHDMGDGWHADVFMPHHGTRRGGFLHNGLLLPAWLRSPRRRLASLLPRYREFAALERRQFALDCRTTFVALSRMVRDHMRDFHAVPPERIRIIPNGVDTTYFQPPTAADLAARERTRRQWNMNHLTVLLLVAHNFRLKGLDTVLAAAAQLNGKRPTVGLVVVGDGDAPRYRRKAQRLGCGSAVWFVGDQADPRPLYHAADLYVQPTFYDPCSLVVLEAFACGLPVITSQYNGAGELMTPGIEGDLIHDPADPAELATAIAPFLDPFARQLAGRAARTLALRHTLERNAQQLLDLYGEVAQHRQAA